MTPNDVQQLVDAIERQSSETRFYFILLLTTGVLLSLWGTYWRAFMAKRGADDAAATKLAQLTHEVEGVKSAYTADLEKLRAEHTADLEALKQHYGARGSVRAKQMEVHQEAFVHWHRVIHSVHKEEGKEIRRAAAEWWVHNCIYLSPDARIAFDEMLHAASMHQSFLDARRPRPELEANWEPIRNAAKVILRGVELPEMPEVYLNRLDKFRDKAVPDEQKPKA